MHDFWLVNERSNVKNKFLYRKASWLEPTTYTCILCSDGHMTGRSVGIWKILMAYARYKVQNARINIGYRFIYLFIYLFITKFLSTYIHIQNTHTYATGIGLRLGLSLPSPVGITVTIHCTNQYIKVTCIINK